MNLGTNDFSHLNITTHTAEWIEVAEKFLAEYKKFVSFLSANYGHVLRNQLRQPLWLFLACGPMNHEFCDLIDEVRSWWENSDTTRTMRSMVDIEIIRFSKLEKSRTMCGHPDALGDAEMARYAERIIRKKTGWKEE